MRRKNNLNRLEPLVPYNLDHLNNLLNINGITIINDKGYDALYVFNMAKSDFLNSSIPDDNYLIRYVKDYLDDADGYDGIAMTRFYADCIGLGLPIP